MRADYLKIREVKLRKQREAHDRDPEKKRRYYLKHRKKKICQARMYFIKNTYGITQEDYEALCRKQKHRCAICGRKKKLHIDHCHKLGHVRALLCGTCNRGLGFFKDNATWLRAAAKYVLKHRSKK